MHSWALGSTASRSSRCNATNSKEFFYRVGAWFVERGDWQLPLLVLNALLKYLPCVGNENFFPREKMPVDYSSLGLCSFLRLTPHEFSKEIRPALALRWFFLFQWIDACKMDWVWKTTSDNRDFIEVSPSFGRVETSFFFYAAK